MAQCSAMHPLAHGHDGTVYLVLDDFGALGCAYRETDRLVLSKRERVIALKPYDKGLLGTRCATLMRCARPRITSATCPTSPLRRTCSRWPSIFSTARPASLTPRPSGTATKRHCWRI